MFPLDFPVFSIYNQSNRYFDIHSALSGDSPPGKKEKGVIYAMTEEMRSEEIQQAVEMAAKKYGAVGVQATTIRHGLPMESYVYGWATKDVDPMTPMHKIRSASITKIAIGIAVMLLREQGILRLDDPLSNYWGDPVVNPNHPIIPITVSTCLTHTTTIMPFGPAEPRGYVDISRRLLQPESYTTAVPGGPAGWAYNNYVFSILGIVLERASNRHLDIILNKGMWNKLGVDAALEAGELRDTRYIATLYRSNGEVGRSVADQLACHRSKFPGIDGTYFAGGLTASSEELARMASVLINRGTFGSEQILTRESVALMEQIQFQINSDGTFWQAQPLDFQEGMFSRPEIYYHTGSAYGAFHLLSYDPASGDGAVVLTSGAKGTLDARGIYAICSEISQVIYDVARR